MISKGNRNERSKLIGLLKFKSLINSNLKSHEITLVEQNLDIDTLTKNRGLNLYNY